MYSSKKTRYIDRLKEENVRLYEDNYKLKETIKTIEGHSGKHHKSLMLNDDIFNTI